MLATLRCAAQVFEINTTAVYTDTLQEISTAMNLDGIVPNETWTLEYASPPLQRVLRTIEVPALSRHRRGVFFVELIGNGVSSRAVVRKGCLRLVERLSIAGHVLRVIDEEDAAVDPGRVSVRLGGHVYRPVDGTGDVVVPYSTAGGSTTTLVVTLDEDLDLADYAVNFRRMFGNERMDAAIGSVEGSVRFHGLTPTSLKLETLDRHQRLLDSYKKLHAARAHVAARQAVA